MLRSNSCDYADAYILVEGTITITGAGDDAAARQAEKRNKGANCAPFTKCISRINIIDIDTTQDIDIIMPIYNLIEYSNNYSKTSGSLWQYYKDESNDHLENPESFKSKVRITGRTPADGNTKSVEIIVPLKYCTIKIWFQKTINWNKYQANPKTYAQNRYLNHLVDPSFQGVNRLVLSFENENDRTSQSTYYLPKAQIKDYNFMIDGKNLFDQPINSDFKTYENIRKIATGQGDDYTTGCLLDYTYFKKYYKMIAIDLSKQQALDADPRAIQQINFTANLDRAGNTAMFFIIEEAKETVFEFSQGTVKVL